MPSYNGQRFYIRLRHGRSRDYNPSNIALMSGESWIYYANSTSVADFQCNLFLVHSVYYILLFTILVSDDDWSQMMNLMV